MATQTITEVEPQVEVKKLPENVMSVGGGEGDAAVDVTYSTKPDIKGMSSGGGVQVGTGIFTSINTQVDPRLLNAPGSVMGVGGGIGDEAVDVTYSTKPDNKISTLGSPTYNTITTEYSTASGGVTTVGVGGAGVISSSGSVMGVGGGIGDEAVDVTYSTKPDNGFRNNRTINKNNYYCNYYYKLWLWSCPRFSWNRSS